MAKKLFTGSEISLTHPQMLELRQAGHLNLGINDTLSAQIANAKGIASKKTTASAAFHFWSWVACGVLGYSIYLSFTSDWWWFILGFIGMNIIWQATKKGNSENLLDVAMIDSEFYERVRKFDGWIYQIEETEVDKYL